MSAHGTDATATAPETKEGRRIRPSSLPALAQCPDFEADPVGRDYTTRGTERHASLARFVLAFLNAAKSDNAEAERERALDGMDEEERDAIEWAAEYVQLHAPFADFPVEVETRRAFVGPDWERIPGTLDIRCGPVVFDFKWRFGDYWEQQAAYALTLLQAGAAKVDCHLMFGQPRKARKRVFTEPEAESVVFPIVEAAQDPNRKPRACDFCGWCAKRLTCPEITDGVRAAMMGRGDWGLKNWHVSEISDPAEMAKALRVARRLKPWCDSAEFHAREMAVKQGRTLPGFKLKTRAGSVRVDNLPGAFAKLGMPQAEFLRCCEVKLNPPKDKSRPGLVDLYARHSVLKVAQAKADILRRLEGFYSITPAVQYLEEQDPASDEPKAPTETQKKAS
jgi:hypothetical protein